MHYRFLKLNSNCSNYLEHYANPKALQGKVTILPMGTTIKGMLTRELSSQTLEVGDSVILTLKTPFYYNGTVIAPTNSNVIGNVTKVRRAGRAEKDGQVKVKFKEIITPQGNRIPISAKIVTTDGSGILKGGTGKDRAKDISKDVAVGAAGGALAGTIFGPISGGKVGKGAALGTAVGAGLGLGKTLIDKGVDVCIPTGTLIDIMIDQPLPLSN